MNDDRDVRWGLAQRFDFIEWRAYWTGRVNRRDLEDEFRISTPQASVDFKRYQEEAPGNIEYDPTEKTYVATADFKPKFLTLSPERYLLQLLALKSGAIKITDTWFDGGDIPEADTVPTIARAPHVYQLKDIIQAIHAGSPIAIDYLSLRRAGNRQVWPHALAYDGYRWHVRALSLETQEFRDYVLARIRSVSKLALVCDADATDDVEWQTEVKLRLVAHPQLSNEQKAAIELDFRMREGKLEVATRVALAYYFIRRHNLDLAANPAMPPERAQLILENADEVMTAVERAKNESKDRLQRRQAKSAEK